MGPQIGTAAFETVNQKMTLPKKELMLAPMVRIGSLPMRLLCLEYGADVVFGPEIVDKSIVGCKRIVNDPLHTTDFISPDGKLVFRTCNQEKDRLIFQIGSADPQLAVQAALKVAADVSGINLNCGCPKRFSIQGGMGAALLSNKPKLLSILSALIKNVTLPISCKIRISPVLQETLELCQQIADIGVSFIIIHGRTPSQTPRDKANWDALLYLHSALKDRIKIVLNGDFFAPSDFEKFPGVNSFMLGRAAMLNPSIFRSLGSDSLPRLEVSRQYLRYAISTGNSFFNTKFTLLSMWEPAGDTGQKIVASKSMCTLFEIFALDFAELELKGGIQKFNPLACTNEPEYVPDWKQFGIQS